MRERETTFQYAFKHTYASTTLSRDGCRLPLRPSPIFFFSLDRFFSRGEERGKREAIPGDGLDGKTKHPGGCLRAAPVIRLAGGEAWSLAPVGVGSRAPATEKARASRRPIGRAEHAACILGWESRLRVGESHAVRNRREYFWTGEERRGGERGRDAFVAQEREREGGD